MMPIISTGIRTCLLKSSSDIFRLKPRFVTSLGQPLKHNDNAEEVKPGNVLKSTNVHQLRGSSADTFGDLSSTADIPADFVEGDEADIAEGTTYSRKQDREKRRVHYSQLITELLSEKKLSMALAVLESEMKAAKAKPDRQIFTQLINFCGKIGYPQKAFSLFNQMKKRGYGTSAAVYTSLFNACANCPIPHIGLKYAERVKKTMDLKEWKTNVITFNAMIKAYGRNGDIETAFYLADQMMREKVPLESRTMSFLLQSCISNKESGFLKALQVWHKMRQFDIETNVYSYNLLIRCARDTGLGSLESVNTVLGKLIPGEKILQIEDKLPENEDDKSGDAYPWEMADSSFVHGGSNNKSSLRHKYDTSNEVSLSTSESRLENIPQGRPNLLGFKPTLGGLVIMEEITKASDRLMLLGGSQGVVNAMLADNLQPDIKTYTLLLDCIPSTKTAEERLMQEMKANQVEPDTGFFNALIYRRGRRFDFIDGFNVLNIMREHQVEIDNITVHSLAYCVTTIETFERFLEDIKEAGFSPTTPMLGSVLKNALRQTNFKFIIHAMDAYQRYELKVHKSTLDQIDEFYTKNLRLLKGKDKPPPNKEAFYKSDFFTTGMKLFICKIPDWKRRVKLDETSDADYHEQFGKTGREAQDLEPYIHKWKKGDRRGEWRKKDKPRVPVHKNVKNN